ncbi:N(4)-(beta-N-acetylglucosaminyl)-L-asparaginase [Paraglaciecola arctica]|uniref:Beta-aspartyl-peptidase n=1 Tax=Paraglaciecola arctica BSs20135 TaxID=493475 RepID=K6Z3V4_9ALTE|nr:N(4)-(beta-N-acetylglucosaminyl)-L-asparaginase [Paraglaciecola arctica]GAC18115.1 beta-aspartyl-peptidase [Paraglaciecola arctica BSs20135]
MTDFNNGKRNFLKLSALSTCSLVATISIAKSPEKLSALIKLTNKPVVVSTWNYGLHANEIAWEVLSNGGKSIDAVEQGIRFLEENPDVMSVGYGSFPDREGKVTLDACIMDENQNCGSVAFLQGIKHPISVARKVMDNTSHEMLVGDGAKQFALFQGFRDENLLTPEAEEAWKKWLVKSNYEPVTNIEDHDTVGMLAIDANGDLSGACSTSGASFKMSGQVGGSSIIGAGLYVDNEVGAATATGIGELTVKTLGCHLVVEMMRQGLSPEAACELAIQRIVKNLGEDKKFQVGFLALNKKGEYGSYSIQSGFNHVATDKLGSKMVDAQNILI